MNVYTDPAMEGYSYSGVHVHEAHGDDPPFAVSISRGRVNAGSAFKELRQQTVYLICVDIDDQRLAEIYVGDSANGAEITARLREKEWGHTETLEFALKFVSPTLLVTHAYWRGVERGVEEQRQRVLVALGLS